MWYGNSPIARPFDTRNLNSGFDFFSAQPPKGPEEAKGDRRYFVVVQHRTTQVAAVSETATALSTASRTRAIVCQWPKKNPERNEDISLHLRTQKNNRALLNVAERLSNSSRRFLEAVAR